MNNEGYEVLRLVSHGDSCHVGSDLVTGTMLFSWVKFHPQIPKEQLFTWIATLFAMVEAYHKSGAKAYNFISPLSIVVTEKEELRLLDLEVPSSRPQRTRMERRSFKEQFYPGEEKFYPDHDSDYYSLGMTILYLLASLQPEKTLSKKEEIYLKHLISQCQKFKFTQRKSLKVVFKERSPKPSKSRAVLVILVVIVVSVLGVKTFAGSGQKETVKEQAPAKKPKEKVTEKAVTNEAVEEEIRLRFHTGMLYLSELQNYRKAGEVFGELFSFYEPAKYYEDIATFLSGEKSIPPKEMEEILELALTNYPPEEELSFDDTLIRTWARLDTPTSRKRLIEVAESATTRSEELLLNLAGAYAREEEKERALECLDELFETSQEALPLEAYRHRAVLLRECEDAREAIDLLTKACELFPQNAELPSLLVKYVGEDEGRSEQVLQIASDQVSNLPALLKDSEFKKVMKENGIKEEGGKLCYED
ncbi:tetratricopeptide (TPR) repeat protein [Lachnospiraceae bacterium PF1-21]|uniref:hypothetical protein n=1 Tax=Ohessyouella blattaphilus TaxID=2949333 RepID=UPI003E23FB3E